jgi:hypothetical protein
MSRTAMGIDHLRATGQPDVNNPGGPDAPVPVGPDIGRWAQAPLGFIHCEPASQAPLNWAPGAPFPLPTSGGGDQTWMYVYNPSTGALIPAGESVKRAGAASPVGFVAAIVDQSLAGAAAANAAVITGVAQYDIPAGFFGFILIKGPGVANLGGGAITGLRGLIPGAAGQLAEAAAASTENTCGMSIAQGGALPLAPVILNCNG